MNMNTYTLVAYVVPDGGHLVREVPAPDATAAVTALRDRLGLKKEDLEVVAVIEGAVAFATVDERQVSLAPYSPANVD